MISRWLIVLFLVLSLIGFLDAVYLTAEYYRNLAVSCTAFGNCEKVTSSQYALIGNIPVALLGAIYYFFIFVLTVSYIAFSNKEILDLMARFTVIGFLASLWFVYLQLFVLRAICAYCLISAFTSTTLFILGLTIIKQMKRSGELNLIEE